MYALPDVALKASPSRYVISMKFKILLIVITNEPDSNGALPFPLVVVVTVVVFVGVTVVDTSSKALQLKSKHPRHP